MQKYRSSLPFAAFLVIVICVSLFSCAKKQDRAERLAEKFERRDKLSKQYCGTCHLPVDPGLLDKETWRNRVLPAMARQLGLEVWQGKTYYQNERSAISHADWTEIVAYYDSLAPNQLPEPAKTISPANDWFTFSLQKPVDNSSEFATTTFVGAENAGGFIYSGDAERSGLSQWNRGLNSFVRTQLPSPAIHMLFNNDKNPMVTCIGEMKAVDAALGNVIQLGKGGNPAMPIGPNFNRPIHTSQGDLNKDNLTDFVVSAFGHNRGGLYILMQKKDGKFSSMPIREVAGATQSIIEDLNLDGWPDIVALFAHGDEGIWVFLNDQKGGFAARNVLRFPPVYGSSSFQLQDMNGDGRKDIIYTAGDNSDYSRILKPYHGLYIFTAESDLHFRQTYFYPINGCTRAMAADFDQDGDLDIATIAFFADLKNKPFEKFLLFEQTETNSPPKLVPHAIPVQNLGRWICMDVSDYDGDGDEDILLGNYSKGFLNQENIKPDWNEKLPFIVLENGEMCKK
ncbi:VCBS repeat-containing protein [Dyadobacter sp. CY323]|uniref:FG-GAP repeat domain-containing protein n=1 Tax=Dyadobacter sp. CY323 TaxID=2907302 RepID=UPI001F38E718|nr:VCBS repeat-containing protein [Dyadobacter sp. CY323]MCE6988548.1 VCBS repeat-containing protein [Dyadobacter sp. CY323]